MDCPEIAFYFFDIEEHENLGPPGFRCLDSHKPHPALLISGTLRNISKTPAKDCRLNIVYQKSPTSKPINEFYDIKLHDELGAGEHIEISKKITLRDADAERMCHSRIGINSLFSNVGELTKRDMPTKVIFTYKNIFGDPFFTVYTMQMIESQGRVVPTMALMGSHAGKFSLELVTAKEKPSV